MGAVDQAPLVVIREVGTLDPDPLAIYREVGTLDHNWVVVDHNRVVVGV